MEIRAHWHIAPQRNYWKKLPMFLVLYLSVQISFFAWKWSIRTRDRFILDGRTQHVILESISPTSVITETGFSWEPGLLPKSATGWPSRELKWALVTWGSARFWPWLNPYIVQFAFHFLLFPLISYHLVFCLKQYFFNERRELVWVFGTRYHRNMSFYRIDPSLEGWLPWLLACRYLVLYAPPSWHCMGVTMRP